MPPVAAQWKRFLSAVDFFAVLGVELAALFLLSLLRGGPFAMWADVGLNVVELWKILDGRPHDEVLALLKARMKAEHAAGASKKGHAPSDGGTDVVPFPDEREFCTQDVALYAFTAKPGNRRGVWALLACVACFILALGGPAWGMGTLLLLSAALLLFGLCRLAQGIMEVV